ncbi:hypothetical protein Tco_1520978, partial [Tanacetum coccineum]
MFNQGLHKEITDMKEVFTQMETEVTKCSIERKTFEIKKKVLLIENDRLLELLISQDLVHITMNSLFEILDCQSMEKIFLGEYSECVELKVELSKKNDMDAPEFPTFFEINELKAWLKAKDNSISKLRDHIATLKAKGHADTLCEIVEHARDLRPLDNDLDSTCKFAIRVQELLVYVQDTCPSSTRESEKLITVTPMNKLIKLGVISSTSASGSKPPGNTKKNRISRPTSSNQNNKVEDYLRSVKYSLNKKNHVSEPVCNANVKHSVLNSNSELICATCNERMFDAIHDLCVLDFVIDVNVRSRIFTINGNTCPLTRITSTIVVPPKKPISTVVVKKTAPNSNTLGKLKDITNI